MIFLDYVKSQMYVLNQVKFNDKAITNSCAEGIKSRCSKNQAIAKKVLLLVASFWSSDGENELYVHSMRQAMLLCVKKHRPLEK